MNIVHELPLSGYAISGVYTLRQQVEPKAVLEETEKGGASFGWDWRLAGDDLLEVLVTVTTEPDTDRPYSASVEVVGKFRRVNPDPSVPLKEFAQLQAVAILLPYLRQFLAMLTLGTEAGSYHLPSVNVVALMNGFNTQEATGAKQLESTGQPEFEMLSDAEPADAETPRKAKPQREKGLGKVKAP